MIGRSERIDETRKVDLVIEAPPRRCRRGYGGIVILGIILGFALGLAYAWLVNPVVVLSTVPASLASDAKDTYRLTIAQSYAATGHLQRAQSRLSLLEDSNVVYESGAQAQRLLGAGFQEEAQTLAQLASDLQSGGKVDPLLIPIEIPPGELPTP